MRFYHKVRFVESGRLVRQIWLCGVLVAQYHTNPKTPKGAKQDLLFFPSKDRRIIRKYATLFYLKINRNENYAIACLNRWFEIAEAMNADCYIICDNKALQKRVVREVNARGIDKKFLPSIKKPRIINNICNSVWAIKAGNAHLSTFYYAKKHKVREFWNIDADDTAFLLNAKKVAKILSSIAQYAQNHHIHAFSLDMCRTRTLGAHWSFGITYTSMECDWIGILEGNADTKWQERYQNLNNGYFNLDWFFTYLGERGIARVATFYIENAFFIHFGDFFVASYPLGLGVSHWQNGVLRYPLLLEIYGSKRFGEVPIAKDCVKFEAGLDKIDTFDFMQNEQSCIGQLSAWDKHWVRGYY